jgi:hypothetical protein
LTNIKEKTNLSCSCARKKFDPNARAGPVEIQDLYLRFAPVDECTQVARQWGVPHYTPSQCIQAVEEKAHAHRLAIHEDEHLASWKEQQCHAFTPAIGSYAAAYAACPISGWWRCTSGDLHVKVEHGEYQFMRKGESMPQAVLLPPRSLWQFIKREQPRFRSKLPSQWQLVKIAATRAGGPAVEKPAAAPTLPGAEDIPPISPPEKHPTKDKGEGEA